MDTYSQHPVAIYSRQYRARLKANHGRTLGPPKYHNPCLIEGCYVVIPPDCTVCTPEHGAILAAQFDAWRANGGTANVFGRYLTL